MPGNLAAAAPSGVLPKVLCGAFSESRVFPMLAVVYHDGTTERSLITDTVNAPASIRTWKLSAQLTATQDTALRSFFEGQDGGAIPFYFYNPYEAAPDSPIGSNWDGTGDSTTGRHTVVFRGNWTEKNGLAISAADLALAEIA